jgi:HEAT repeat protein
MAMSLEGSAGEWYSSVPGTDEIYHIIDEATAEKNPQERIRAVIALGDSGDPRAVRPLVRCCSDSNPEIRRHAVVGLEKLKSPRAVDTLIERLKDRREENSTRIRAAAALAAIRSYSAIEGLNERYSDLKEDPVIRAYIAEILQKEG